MWVLCRISLSDKVRDDALQLRQRCMGRLEEVFHSRQAVNLEAVKVLLPQVEGEQPLWMGNHDGIFGSLP